MQVYTCSFSGKKNGPKSLAKFIVTLHITPVRLKNPVACKYYFDDK